ncbi:hypothetical protein SpAn4DRAFT_5119 [Sporomusa ovata]|uniref:Uncharacterized protein n=1 Tax=Sporomusa ovata TaxID=2378 RepID=A0A0U1L198_9FIRM|nr:hypothetical protein SpAn4DRAFT_5119 [Sporomusa ovata]
MKIIATIRTGKVKQSLNFFQPVGERGRRSSAGRRKKGLGCVPSPTK